MNENFINENEEELYGEKNNNTIKYILMVPLAVIIVLLILFLFPKSTTISKTNIENMVKQSSKNYFEK